MNRRAMTKPQPLIVFALALLLGACKPAEVPSAMRGTDLAGATIGGSFTLTGSDGKTVRWEDFAGKYRIVYFGYTFCPDACPTDVGVMMQGFTRFARAHPDRAAKVQPIFISIDPARDTPAKVGEFAAAFGPPLIGLTGTAEQVAGAAKAFMVYYARGKDSTGGYLMDHSRFAYLMDPQGRPVEGLPVDQGAEAVAADLADAVK
jgi:protein SCO1